MIKPKALTSLSIVFPCRDESSSVGPLIEEALQVGDRYGTDYEVLVVDDGSRDDTAGIIDQWAKKNPRVRLLRHAGPRGLGAAVRTGLEKAQKDLIFLTDGDHQFRVSDIDKLFSKIDSCDAVVGYRLGRQGGTPRKLASFLWTQANRALFGLHVRDVNCGFKLFRRRALEGLPLRADSRFIHAEILGRIVRAGGRIQEIGVSHYPRSGGRSKAYEAPALLGALTDLAGSFWAIRSARRTSSGTPAKR